MSRCQGFRHSTVRPSRTVGQTGPMTSTLVLLRHGQSEWNLENLFTGWYDADLTDQGGPRPPAPARRMADAGVAARRAAHLAADPGHPHRQPRPRRDGPALDPGAALVAAQRAPLRRPPGPGQEGDHREVRRGAGQRCGAAATTCRRPPLEPTTSATPASTPATPDLPARRPPRRRVPRGRRRPDAALLVRRASSPTCDAGTRRVLVVAHGNSLRALVKHLDGISDDDIAELNIPTGVPDRSTSSTTTCARSRRSPSPSATSATPRRPRPRPRPSRRQAG